MTYHDETRILKADEGKWITNDGVNFAIEAKLAPGDDVSNWWEVDELPPEPIETKIDYIADENEPPAQDTGGDVEQPNTINSD